MLKHLLLVALLLASPAALAQTAPLPAAPTNRFCVVRSAGVLSDKRPNFSLDYSPPTSSPDYPAQFRKEALHSAADMLNYMDHTGWELVSTTAVAGAWPAGSVPSVEYQYIFRRRVD